MEQDAARARRLRKPASARLRVTDRVNYVALPSVAARGVAERREIRRDERTSERCSDPAPGRAVPQTEKPQHSGLRSCVDLRALGAPKGDALFAMWLSQAACGERSKTRCAFRRAMPLIFFEGVNQAGLAHARGTLKRQPARYKWRGNNVACANSTALDPAQRFGKE